MKTIIYQVLTRLWKDGRMSSWQKADFDYLKSLNVDYVWFTGIPRHATGKDFVKGNPGSPYSITDWMDINPYLADNEENRMEEFRSLVKRTHGAGLKCIIDFIPNHVAKDYRGKIAHFDYCDADWTDTLKNDYGNPATFPALLEILRFWASLGVDGFRCDMVELVPPDALKGLVSEIKSEYPDMIFIAEAYGRENYHRYAGYVGFDLLYDKSGAYDILRDIICCGGSARRLTWNWQELGELQPKMLNFLENHDEQRIASREFAGSPEKAYAALAFSALFNTASFMLYFGQEAGENAEGEYGGRTSIFEWHRPNSMDRIESFITSGNGVGDGVREHYGEILKYAAMPVFRKGETWDLCYCQPWDSAFNPDRHFAFLRYLKGQKTAWTVVCNFSGEELDTEIYIPREPMGKEKRVSARVPSYGYSVIRTSWNSI